jgi:hypothetical protein
MRHTHYGIPKCGAAVTNCGQKGVEGAGGHAQQTTVHAGRAQRAQQQAWHARYCMQQGMLQTMHGGVLHAVVLCCSVQLLSSHPRRCASSRVTAGATSSPDRRMP